MEPSLRTAALTVLITVALVAFVASIAFTQAREQLASEFADAEYAVSVYTARHVRDQYNVASLALAELAALPDAAAVAAVAEQRRALVAGLLEGSEPALVLYDGEGRLSRAWPDGLEPPPEPARREAWPAAPQAAGAPAFYLAADRTSRLLLLRSLPSGGGAAAIGLVLSVPALLRPPMVAGPEGVEVLLVDPTTMRVVASSVPLADDRPFDEMYDTPSRRLFDVMRSPRPGEYGGSEQNAWRIGPNGEQTPYLVGVSQLVLGSRRLVVSALGPRHRVVDFYLRRILGWIALIGAVVVLSIGSFLMLLRQAQLTATQDRRLSDERFALYQVSLALLSANRLEDILQMIADRARELVPAEGATIALVDDDEGDIVFHSVSSEDPAVRRQLHNLRVPRGAGVIGWVVDHGEAVLVNDVNEDKRFTGSVDRKTGMQTMSLLCAPLLDQQGRCFGALELVNNRERPFPDQELVLLRSLAATASAAVERAVLLQKEARQERLQHDLEIARTVQNGLLPQHFPEVSGYTFNGASEPAREVGGDFFDFIEVGDRHIGVVIADVADKGVGAAMFMVMCRSLLAASAQREMSPARALEDLNGHILSLSESDLFVTVFYGLLELETGRFTFSNAGHNPPVVYHRATHRTEQITVPGIALGVIEPIQLREATVQFQPGDRLVCYTDGVTDALNAEGDAFGVHRLEHTLLDFVADDAVGTVQMVLNNVRIHTGREPQFDDITLAVVALDPPAGGTSPAATG